MAILKSYDLKGNKLSFANWISNLSPTETPFTSMINKEAVDQVRYSWQVDRLSAPANVAISEGASFSAPVLAPTQVLENYTQILRHVVKVTDTANKVGLYGRASEKAYQMEKAGKEIRRDLELMVLRNGKGTIGTKATPRTFSGFSELVAPLGLADRDTGAIVHKIHQQGGANAPLVTEAAIFDLTYNLYLAGSKANKVMVHPMHMVAFSNLIGESTTGAVRMFDGVEDKYNAFVKSFRDPLGQVFEIIPNRFMPEHKIYFFNEADWTQMILREPKTVELARNGSAEKHMIEMEVGLRHRNPYASGVLELKAHNVDTLGIRAYFTHDAVVPNQNNKLMVEGLKNGALDTTAGLEVIVTQPAGAGWTPPLADSKFTLVDGKKSFDIKFAVPGTYTFKLAYATGEETSVEMVVVSARGVNGLVEEQEEVAVAAPKAKKVKA